ncbi:tryptophan 2,3-dioxygenase family protein [Hydrotalea sp.]|uniref:tryptophan 2,3-dioxygenase family protein n=3 Tax=Hydrotalea sp. TaxID=2881279 RepID=UPI00260C97D1|nr:tryptophan 2,3-dioxygenase family protein [Hydrotalea sp.]
MEQVPPYYHNYLQLDNILNSQLPISFENGNEPAHDEMLFIIIHQAYELWFKQILFEIDSITAIFSKETINDNTEDAGIILQRIKRINSILQLLNQQVHILDTMTPLDFLSFRNLLVPASGFQSVQFRMIEARLGLKMQQRHRAEYYKRTNEGGFTMTDYSSINEVEATPSLAELLNRWLERMPFLNLDLWKHYQLVSLSSASFTAHPFWNDYRHLYTDGLNEHERNKLNDFDFVLFNQNNGHFTEEQCKALRLQFTAPALQSALFIILYRNYPLFQTSFQIIDALIETDHLLSTWRHEHLTMVRRMIGMRVGTGNTSGAGYLEGAAQQHFIFKDLAGLSTFLIVRKKLPALPDAVLQHLTYG